MAEIKHEADRAGREEADHAGARQRAAADILEKARLASPMPVSAKPLRSSGRRPVSFKSETNMLTSTMPNTPIGMLMKNIQRHEA